MLRSVLSLFREGVKDEDGIYQSPVIENSIDSKTVFHPQLLNVRRNRGMVRYNGIDSFAPFCKSNMALPRPRRKSWGNPLMASRAFWVKHG